MSIETIAWLVVSIAGIAGGVIAGSQQRVTVSSVIAIFAAVAVTAGIVSRILPRNADHVS
jgi:type III secretory pathway component EscV